MGLIIIYVKANAKTTGPILMKRIKHTFYILKYLQQYFILKINPPCCKLVKHRDSRSFKETFTQNRDLMCKIPYHSEYFVKETIDIRSGIEVVQRSKGNGSFESHLY